MERLVYETEKGITTSYAEVEGKPHIRRYEKVAEELRKCSSKRQEQLDEKGFVTPTSKYRLGGR